MDQTAPDPSRRTAMILLGAGALTPVALAVLSRQPGGGADAGGLRFDVLDVTRGALPGHVRHASTVVLAEAPSWPDVVRVQLRVRNLAALPLLLSPGQFRLRVDRGVTVMPTGWRHGPAPLGGGDARTGWIDFRAPAGGQLFDLEFTPAGQAEPVAVPLAVPLTVLSAGPLEEPGAVA
jgi:hypothetical protein